MATAVIVANLRNKQAQNAASSQEEPEQQEDFAPDGKLRQSTLQKSMDKLTLRASKILQRLTLEDDLEHMLIKLPNFCMCMVCFLIALVEFTPPEGTYNVHRQLEGHFGLDGVSQVKDFDAVYQYLATFEEKNAEMQATSAKYWCESRYSTHVWDDHLEVPRYTCQSPRFYALGLTTDAGAKWSALNPGSGSSSSSGSSSAISSSSGNSSSSSGSSSATSSSSGSSNSASSSSNSTTSSSSSSNATTSSTASSSGTGSSTAGSSSGSGSGIYAMNDPPPCGDDDAKLQIEENNPNLTCANFASHVCETELGILVCASTCGFCSPFTYEHTKTFVKPTVTMLPVVVYQTRVVATECEGFALTYENQPYNPQLTLMPALDGRRIGRTLTCIDRNTRYEEDYAMKVECPPNGPVTHCHDGVAKITERQEFHGDTIYPKLLIEPDRDIKAMKAIEWLDKQTDTLSMSTMIYTEGMEVFTSLSVDFSIDEAGNVDGGYTMVSYRDLINAPRGVFIGCLVACCVGALVGVVISIMQMVKHAEDCKWGTALYELFSRCVLFIYPVVLLVSWSQQVTMAEEYDHLLHAFLDLKGMEQSDLEQGMKAFFDSKTHLYSETTWLMRHRVTAYLVCYVQFLQLIFYFNSHPKMAVMTATISKAASGIIHFMMLFVQLFAMLAFMAHWMLGEHVVEFGTYGDTIKSQVRMVFGEFIMAPGAEDLHGANLIMYWVYAGTFVFLVTMTLLNFFLAIVVDAFIAVKDDNAENVVVKGFLGDLFSVFTARSLAARHKWPPRKALMDYFEKVIDEQGDKVNAHIPKWIRDLDGPNKEEANRRKQATCTHSELMNEFPDKFDEHTVATFIHHYYLISSTILKPRGEGGEAAAANPEEQAAAAEDVTTV